MRKGIVFTLCIFFSIVGCSTPPEEPIFDYKAEVGRLKENNSKRKKTVDPVEIEQICQDNEEGRRRALDAFVREKSFAIYWMKVAESRKADAQFGKSVKNWILFFDRGSDFIIWWSFFIFLRVRFEIKSC